MTDWSQRIADLPPEKRALLEQRLQSLAKVEVKGASIARRAVTGPMPLSFSQERLWFLAHLYPGQTAYNEASAYRLQGPLDIWALQAALNGIVDRHEVLRTTYHHQDGRPAQVVGQPRAVPLPLIDLSGMAEDERLAAAQQRFAEVIETPFDLANDLTLRACLYRLGEYDHILLTVRHHIASDGWSSRRFWSEFQELYAAETTGQPARLPDLPIQYPDYAVWQRGWLQGERLESHLDYWRRQLAGLPPLHLPTDRRRPETLSFHGAGERFALDEALVVRLQALARQEGTTLHTVLLAAYALLLFRMTGQDDLAVGVPVAGRVRAELEPLIGFFVNTLVIRAQISGNPSFRDHLGQMRQTMLAAIDHQELPFEKLVAELEPERHLNRNPLIATSFQLFESPRATFILPQVSVEAIAVPNLHAKFDMECSLVLGPEGVSGHWRYATDLFDAPTIQRMISLYQTLLAAIAEDPDHPIGQLSMLTVAEQSVLADWGITAPPAAPPVRLVHELFEQQVARTPETVAVAGDGFQLTYLELHQRTNQVARRLQELGVGPGTTVGLYLDRTAALVVGLLGVLKAGGTFVPLDTAAPPARLRLLAQDANLRLVLSTEALRSSWPESGLAVECLDGEQWARYESEQAPDSAVGTDSAAYILYTSGSTGTPKGVVVEHRQLLSYVMAAVEQYDMSGGGVFAMVQPVTFDSCHTMLFPALGWGGTLYLFSRDASLDATALSAHFEHHRPDFLKISPAHLVALGTEVGFERLMPRRCLVIGGEAIHWDLADQLLATAPSCAIWNEYGPTETTVGVLVYEIRAGGVTHRPLTASVPVGRPLAGARIYILDRHGNPAPIGVQGELCVAGPFVTRGYLNRPDATAAQFHEDTLSGETGARLYHTGDRARWLTDGVVEFLGRADDQVKVRGHRVELGEIEAVLGEHPGVAERSVVLRGGGGQAGLVAYLSARPDRRLDPGELDSFLRARLPEVMVPGVYVVLEALPRTPHGKIDRAALPAPDAGARPVSASHVAPRSPEEEAIAAIWCEVLRLERVGVHDNFFELGGHSLLGIQVFSRIEAHLGQYLPLSLLFEAPTVAQLAAHLGQLGRGAL